MRNAQRICFYYLSFFLVLTVAILSTAAPDGSGDKYKLIITSAPAEGENVPTIDVQIAGLVKDTWDNVVAGVRVEVLFAGDTHQTYTDKAGEFFFSILPDSAGTYSAIISVPEFGLTETITGIGYDPSIFKVGGITDPHELYYDWGRQFGHPQSIYNYIQDNHEYLRWTHFRVEIADESFDDEVSGNRQFPSMTGPGGHGQATFPWFDPNQSGTMTATVHNNAANDLNPQFFQRMNSFITHYTNPQQQIGQPYRVPLKVIVCVIDPWLMGGTGHPGTDPWMKAAQTLSYAPPYRQVLDYLPEVADTEPIAIRFHAYLEMLAQFLGSMSEASQSLVYIEFNNEKCWYTEDPDDLYPTNEWLYKWVNEFYELLVENGAQEIAKKMMINTFTGNPYTHAHAAYVKKCWCDRPVWEIAGVPQIRNQFISGHQCSSPGQVNNVFCEYLEDYPPPGENCDCNRRISFFTEGGVNAGSSGCDEYVYQALQEDEHGLRFHFALGYNNMYRDVSPWGACVNMSEAVAINEGILCAVVNAKDGNPSCSPATCE
jgi:hypothetical protein